VGRPGTICDRCALKAYRLLTEDDTSAFCHKVTAALAKGWDLYGDPAYAFDQASGKLRCAQAVTKETEGEYSPDVKLSAL
jgi:hypothetical protein